MIEIDNILTVKNLKNETELEQATSLFSKLRILARNDLSLKEVRKHLGKLIKKYEDDNWSNADQVTDEQIIESDLAEHSVEFENDFIQARKLIIKEKLKGYL